MNTNRSDNFVVLGFILIIIGLYFNETVSFLTGMVFFWSGFILDELIRDIYRDEPNSNLNTDSDSD